MSSVVTTLELLIAEAREALNRCSNRRDEAVAQSGYWEGHYEAARRKYLDLMVALAAVKQVEAEETQYCHAGRDGDCAWADCPQRQEGEPEATGRSCPLWTENDDD